VNLRAGYTDDNPEKTVRYLNGLRMEILDEISILSPRNIEEAFQSAVKAEEKINRTTEQQEREREWQRTGTVLRQRKDCCEQRRRQQF